MTGFGVASRSSDAGRVVAEVRSVNARTLDVRVRQPDVLGDTTAWAEQRVRRRLRRGRVEVAIRWEGPLPASALLDRVRARSVAAAIDELARELGHVGPPPLSLVVSVPGVFATPPEAARGLRGIAEGALDEALEALDADLAREGRAISAEIVDRAARVGASLQRAAAVADRLPAVFRERLAARLARAAASIDEPRLEAEIALLADRADVGEEVSRLRTHLAYLVEVALGRAEAPEGRRFDFLIVEMLREATTMAAKAQDAEVSREVVAMKVELERMREQVQNVE